MHFTMYIFFAKYSVHPTKPKNTTNTLKFNDKVTLILHSLSVSPTQIALLNSIFDHVFGYSSFDFRETQVAGIKLKILFLWNNNI